jgi:hypothetical protein
MMLRINEEDVLIIDGKLVNAPTLLEQNTDVFRFTGSLQDDVELLVGGQQLEPSRDFKQPNVVRWQWEKGPFSRLGFVQCQLRLGGNLAAEGILRVEPWKFSLEQYAGILHEIERIAYNIVYDLRDLAFETVELFEPAELPKSGIEWLETVQGFMDGLESALEAINTDPHVFLRTREVNTFTWAVSRPGGSLITRLTRPGDDWLLDRDAIVPQLSGLLGGRLPMTVPEEIHERSTDVYENRVIAQFLQSVRSRLRSVGLRVSRPAETDLADLLFRKVDALQSLPFLAEVKPLCEPPVPTLVLLRNFRYRQFYEIYRRFHWGLRVELTDPDAGDLFKLTTKHVHDTYEMWAFFKVLEAIKNLGKGTFFNAGNVLDILQGEELLINIRGNSEVVVRTAESQYVQVIYKRRFDTAWGKQVFCVALPKIPDIVVQIAGAPHFTVLDAKYRLDSERTKGGVADDGKPKPEDIEKMQVYRDSIRSGTDREHLVHAAHVLYPGTVLETYDEGRVGAIPLRPDDPQPHLQRILKTALGL